MISAVTSLMNGVRYESAIAILSISCLFDLCAVTLIGLAFEALKAFRNSYIILILTNLIHYFKFRSRFKSNGHLVHISCSLVYCIPIKSKSASIHERILSLVSINNASPQFLAHIECAPD